MRVILTRSSSKCTLDLGEVSGGENDGISMRTLSGQEGLRVGVCFEIEYRGSGLWGGGGPYRRLILQKGYKIPDERPLMCASETLCPPTSKGIKELKK